MLFAFAFRSIPFGNNFLNWLSNNITLNAASAFLFRVSHSSDDGFPSACQMRPQHEADNSNRNGNHHRVQHGKSSVLVFVSLPSVPYEDRGPRAASPSPSVAPSDDLEDLQTQYDWPIADFTPVHPAPVDPAPVEPAATPTLRLARWRQARAQQKPNARRPHAARPRGVLCFDLI